MMGRQRLQLSMVQKSAKSPRTRPADSVGLSSQFFPVLSQLLETGRKRPTCRKGEREACTSHRSSHSTAKGPDCWLRLQALRSPQWPEGRQEQNSAATTAPEAYGSLKKPCTTPRTEQSVQAFPTVGKSRAEHMSHCSNIRQTVQGTGFCLA